MGRHAGLIDFEILSLTPEKVMFAGGQPEVSFQQEPRAGHRTSISTNGGLWAEGLSGGSGRPECENRSYQSCSEPEESKASLFLGLPEPAGPPWGTGITEVPSYISVPKKARTQGWPPS